MFDQLSFYFKVHVLVRFLSFLSKISMMLEVRNVAKRSFFNKKHIRVTSTRYEYMMYRYHYHTGAGALDIFDADARRGKS